MTVMSFTGFFLGRDDLGRVADLDLEVDCFFFFCAAFNLAASRMRFAIESHNFFGREYPLILLPVRRRPSTTLLHFLALVGFQPGGNTRQNGFTLEHFL